jgi:hypothetical protein
MPSQFDNTDARSPHAVVPLVAAFVRIIPMPVLARRILSSPSEVRGRCFVRHAFGIGRSTSLAPCTSRHYGSDWLHRARWQHDLRCVLANFQPANGLHRQYGHFTASKQLGWDAPNHRTQSNGVLSTVAGTQLSTTDFAARRRKRDLTRDPDPWQQTIGSISLTDTTNNALHPTTTQPLTHDQGWAIAGENSGEGQPPPRKPDPIWLPRQGRQIRRPPTGGIE